MKRELRRKCRRPWALLMEPVMEGCEIIIPEKRVRTGKRGARAGIAESARAFDTPEALRGSVRCPRGVGVRADVSSRRGEGSRVVTMAMRKRKPPYGSTPVGEKRLLSSLTPHPANFRRHTEYQLAILRESLRVHGQQKPVVITPDGTILAGHGLVEAARAEGWTHIACHIYDGPYPEAFLAMDNRASDLAEDDSAALATLLSELRAKEQLGAAGYDDKALDTLLADLKRLEPVREEGPIPEVQEGPTRVQPGELWALGKHRVACGDSCDPEHVQRLMGARLADICFTDPRYNLGPKLYAQNAEGMLHVYKALADSAWDTDFALRPALDAFLPAMSPDCTVYVCTSQYLVSDILAWVKDWAEFHNYCVWCKPNPAPALSKRHWTWATELVVYGVRGKHICNFPAEGHALNWWNIPARSHETDHPAEKPVVIPAKAIEFSSTPGQAVLDVFGGSGSTLLAAEQLGRHAYLSELDPRYCDVILARWEAFTGQQAVKVDA